LNFIVMEYEISFKVKSLPMLWYLKKKSEVYFWLLLGFVFLFTVSCYEIKWIIERTIDNREETIENRK